MSKEEKTWHLQRRRVTPFIPSSHETCAPPLEGAYVCAPTNHVARGRARPICASKGGRARTRPSTGHAPLLWSPLGRGRPYAYTHAPLHHMRPRPCAPHGRSCPTRRSRPHVRAPRGACAPRSRPPRCSCPWKPFTPYHVRAS
jgi:hypothetical protein